MTGVLGWSSKALKSSILRTEKATGTRSLAGQSGSLMSMVESRLYRGAFQSNDRPKCDQDPQIRAMISRRISTTMIRSISHRTRPRSRAMMMSMRMCVPSRCT